MRAVEDGDLGSAHTGGRSGVSSPMEAVDRLRADRGQEAGRRGRGEIEAKVEGGEGWRGNGRCGRSDEEGGRE